MYRSRLWLMLILTLLSTSAAAEATRRGDAPSAAAAQAQAQLQAQLQAAADARAALQSENAKLKEELEAIKKDAARLRGDKAVLQQQVATSGDTVARFKEANGEAMTRLRDTQERMDKLVEKYKELVATIKEMETDKARLQDEVGLQAAQLDACAQHNLAMYQLNVELLEQYRNKGVWDALRQREPVTGLGRVEVENMMEQYRDRLQKARLNEDDNLR